MVNVWPHYQPDKNVPETYEKYCYARMLLHHPFVNEPKDTLLKDHVNWIAAYHSDCIDQGHFHMDSLPPTCNELDVEINMAGDDTYQFGLTSGGRGGKWMGDTIITSYLNT